MVDKPTDDLTAHSVEWVSDTIDRWIAANELAQRIQAGLPHYVHERLALLPPGHDALPMAMAMSMPPGAVREAHEWLVSARAQISLIASLSQGLGMMDTKTDAERGAVADDESQVQADLAEVRRMVEQNGRGLTEILRRLDARDDAESRRSARPVA